MSRSSALLLSAAAVALTSAACTSSGGDESASSSGPGASSSSAAPSSSVAASSSAASSSSTASTPITQPKSVPASVPNLAGVITGKLVSLTSCKATTGGWQGSGTAMPRAGRTTSYTVTVFFTTNTSTVQAFGQTKVTVPTGKTAEWTVAANFTAAPGTLCVLRGAG